jgi:hypothetical protein
MDKENNVYSGKIKYDEVKMFNIKYGRLINQLMRRPRPQRPGPIPRTSSCFGLTRKCVGVISAAQIH